MKELLWDLNMYFHFPMFQFKMGACLYIKKSLQYQVFDPNYKSSVYVGVCEYNYLLI